MNDTLLWIGVGTALVAGLWSGYTVFYEGNLERPDYQVTARDGVYELRTYDSFVIASTPMRSSDRSGMNGGFRSLAGYIFGGNRPQEKLAMTVPVMTSPKGEKLPMTAPVMTRTDDRTMAFVMPKGRTVEDLPQPNSDKVSLRRVDWGLAAAVRYNGYATPERVKHYRQALMTWIAAQGYESRAGSISAQYNSPSAMPLLRRNEIIVLVRPLTNGDEAKEAVNSSP